MATEPPPPSAQNRIVYLLLAGVLALGIAMGGAYLVVVSQNPSTTVTGPTFVYGSPSR
jgi:hypothetical protein